MEGLEVRVDVCFSVATLEARNPSGRYVTILKEKGFPPAYSQSRVKYHEAILRNWSPHNFASHAPFLRKLLEGMLSYMSG